MDAKSRSYRLEIGLRRNQCKQLLASFLDDLAMRLGRSKDTIQLLDLEQTDHIRALMRDRISAQQSDGFSIFRREWIRGGEVFEDHEDVITKLGTLDELSSLLRHLREQVQAQPMVLFRSGSVFCGGVEVTSAEILENAFRLAELGGDGLIAACPDASCGIILDYNEDTIAGLGIEVEIYDIKIWGEEWLKPLAGQPMMGPPYLARIVSR